MEKIILNATERLKHPGKFKESGFIPGVLYGDSISESASVKFEETPLKRILAQHGANAKVWIAYNDNKIFGFIKEVQKHPVSGKVIHIDVQSVSKDHEIKMQLPIIFKGEEELKAKQLQMQVYKSEISVMGKIGAMPDSAQVDIAEMNLGDTITIKDFDLNKNLKVSDSEDAVYGTIINIRTQPVEEPAEAKTEA